MFLNVEDRSIGITKLEVYLPETYCPILQSHFVQAVASDQYIESTWRDLAMEPQYLAAFIRTQIDSGVRGEPVTVDGFVRKTGIRGFYCADDESSSDMAIRVADRLLAEPEERQSVDRVIFYHSTLSEYPVWSTACRLQYALSLPNIPVFSISQKGGNAFAMALRTACEMLVAEPDVRRILLVGSDKLIPPYERMFRGLTAFGDSANAMLVERSTAFLQVLSVDTVDYPEWWNPFQMDVSATERMLEFISGDAATMLQRSLESIKACPDDLTLLLPPNLNRQFSEQLAERCNLSPLKVYVKNLGATGCLMNSDMGVNCLSAEQEGLLPQGSLLAVVGFGLGTSLSCTLMRRGPCDVSPLQTQTTHLPVSLTHSSYYLPPDPITVDDYAEAVGLGNEQRDRYKAVHGLDTIHISRGKTPLEFAVEAGRKALALSGLPPSSIDALIVHHTFFMLSFEPRTLVGELQHQLGLSRALGLALSGQACASVIGALAVARNMIWTKSAKTVLVVGTDSFLGSQQARELQDTTLMGEGASAVILQANTGRGELIHLCNFVSGSAFRVRNVDSKFQVAYFLGCIRAIRDVLNQTSLSFGDIDLLIPHNINNSSWKVILPHIHCNSDKFYSTNIARRGHVCGSDLIINLTDALDENRVEKGDYALLMTAGLGTGWGSAIIRI